MANETNGPGTDGARATRKPLNAWLVMALFGLPFAGFILFLLAQGSSPAKLEARFAARPDLGEAVATFRDHYPEGHAAFLNRMVSIADARGAAEAERAAIAEIRAFLAARAESIARAPVADLDALGDAIAETAQALQRANPELCAQFVARGAIDPARLPEQATRAIGRMNALMFRAARNGEGEGAVRRTGLPRGEVAAWLERAEAHDPGLATEPADAERQCTRGVALYRAAAELPEAQSANVTAYLMLLSFGRPPAG